MPKPDKPSFWPTNPYPASIFTMPEERYPEIVPDPELRTALSGMLGRHFWDIASEAIWAAMLEHFEQAAQLSLCPNAAERGSEIDHVWCPNCDMQIELP